jgi:hypothetical protein
MNKVKRYLTIFKIWLLKIKANNLYKQTGVQQFIVKWYGKTIIINKAQFKQLRQKGVFPITYTAVELKKISLYHTKGK